MDASRTLRALERFQLSERFRGAIRALERYRVYVQVTDRRVGPVRVHVTSPRELSAGAARIDGAG